MIHTVQNYGAVFKLALLPSYHPKHLPVWTTISEAVYDCTMSQGMHMLFFVKAPGVLLQGMQLAGMVWEDCCITWLIKGAGT